MNKKAFTLAEVLITLVIIGVVAALTIPTLFKNADEKSNIVAFRKVYSNISQINLMLKNENDGDWTTQCNNFDNICFRNLFAKKMKAAKLCNNPVNENCVATSKYKNGENAAYRINVNDSWPALVTSSGYSIKFRFHLKGCLSEGTVGERDYTNLGCGWIQVDTNGRKKPNIVGKDIFFLTFNANGSVSPFGSEHDLDHQGLTMQKMENDCYNGTGMFCGMVYLVKNK